MRLGTTIAAVLVGAIIMLSACSSSGGKDTRDNSAVSMNLNDQIVFSIKDLARRQGKEEDSIVLVAVRQVTWRSGALGCPKHGVSYTQALVPGVLIILTSGQENFSYHASRSGEPFYCPGGRVQPPASIQVEDLA